MLTIHFSNRQERLADLLTAQLGQGTGSLFTPDEVIVPSAALRRQITLQVARQQGICTQVRFSYLAQWLWLQVGRVMAVADGTAGQAGPADAGGSPLQAGVLSWRIYQALAGGDWVARHPRLASYLAQADALTRLALSQRLATLIEQYSTYRPEWLLAWSEQRTQAAPPGLAQAQADEAWQAELWRVLLADLPDGLSRATLAESLRHRLSGVDVQALQALGLPARAHVFCLPTIAPVHLAMLAQLGQWMDLQVYAINPCQEYWFDVVDAKRLGRLARAGRANHHDTGNRLLAAWGQQAQAQLATLVDTCGDAAIDDELFEPQPGTHLLAQLQNAMLGLTELAPRSVPLRTDDHSIEVHVCHSLTRELEVLQDRLLSLFAAQDGLQASDVLVVTPKLDDAAPLIEAVFGTAPRQRYLPFTLTGLAVSPLNPCARALLDLLALVATRCTVNDVWALLQQPVVARRFGLDDEALAQVQAWLAEAGIHWALDAEHIAQLQLPDSGHHSFEDGLDRLFMAYAVPAQVDAPLGQVLPAGQVDGLGASALGALWQFVQALRQARAALAGPHTPDRWPDLLIPTLDALVLAQGAELDDRAELVAAIQGLAQPWQRAQMQQALPADVVRQALAAALDEAARGGVPTGHITFSSMSSLRYLPYKVVCVLGLNDGAFPGAVRPDEFDLMALAPRAGDRQRRADERNVFLDLVLAARDQLILSYTGRHVRDNSEMPPSVLVAELLETIVPALAATEQAARAHLVLHHPLQPFSISLFQDLGDTRLRSHHAEYARALAASLAGPPLAGQADVAQADPSGDDETESDDASDDDHTETAGAPFFQFPLPPPEPSWHTLDLDQLLRFFAHPCRYLLVDRLGIYLPYEAEALDDVEPLVTDGRTAGALARRLLPALAAGADDAHLTQLALADHHLPAGTLGQQSLQESLPSLRRFYQQWAPLTAPPLLPAHHARLTVLVQGQAWQLDASLAHLRADGLVLGGYQALRARDVLAAWIQHLVLCTCAPAGVRCQTIWLGRDERLHFRAAEQAPALLDDLVGLYAQGLSAPLYFFPRSAWALLKPNGGSPSKSKAAWHNLHNPGASEQADAAHALALRGLPDPMTEGWRRFEALAQQVLAPALAHMTLEAT